MRATWFLVRWGNSPGGWSEVDAEPEGERIEATLGLGHISSRAEALRVAAAELDRFTEGQVEVTVGIDPEGSGDVPYTDYGIGDLVEVDSVEYRVISLTVGQDPQIPGRLIYVPQLGDVIDSQEVRLQRAAKKMINGTLGGASRVATPLTLMPGQALPATASPPIPGGGGGGG